MTPGFDAFSELAFGGTPAFAGAILGDVLLQSTASGEITLQPTYTAHITMEPGSMATVYADNDTDFKVFSLQRTRDNSPINDAILAGSLADAAHKGVITNATNASPIVITSANHGRATGQQVFIDEVESNRAANGPHTITVIDANTFSLDGSVGIAEYTVGGRWWLGVPGALDIPLNHIAGSNGNYVGLIPGSVPLIAGHAYVRFVTCSNYELRWGNSPLTAQIRT